MIDANELRRGNYILYTGNYALYAGKMKQVCWIEGDCIRLNDHADKYRYEDCNPIPLTPEILSKAGFSNKPGSSHAMFWHINRFTFSWLAQLKSLSIIITTQRIDIYYLHQLQNFYFALTGEELKIEL